MKRITKIYILAMLFGILFGFSDLFAQKFLNNIEKGELNGFSTLKGETDSGIEVTVIQMIPFTDHNLQLRCYKLIESLSIIPVNSIRVTSKPDGIIDILFSIDNFQWNGYNMDEYLSSGFLLKISDSIDYDADLFIDRLHIRLEGFFESEVEFLDKIANVISKPGAFLMSRDPEYILETFLNIQDKDVELELQFASIQDELEKLKLEKATLEKELTELKYNNLVMENRGIFGSIRKMNRSDVDWIINEKSVNPKLTSAQLKNKLVFETGSKIDTRSIDLILGLYFGEYRK